jgi:hypothetical protein
VKTCKRISVVSVTCTVLEVLSLYFKKAADYSKRTRNVGGLLVNGSIFSNVLRRVRRMLEGRFRRSSSYMTSHLRDTMTKYCTECSDCLSCSWVSFGSATTMFVRSIGHTRRMALTHRPHRNDSASSEPCLPRNLRGRSVHTSQGDIMALANHIYHHDCADPLLGFQATSSLSRTAFVSSRASL